MPAPYTSNQTYQTPFEGIAKTWAPTFNVLHTSLVVQSMLWVLIRKNLDFADCNVHVALFVLQNGKLFRKDIQIVQVVPRRSVVMYTQYFWTILLEV